MDKRYQIFVSSTFKDLKDERDVVIKTLLEMNFFPAGMEIFPSAHDSQTRYIKKIIDDSDYYVLIIAGKYGSLNKEGISYTEMEFDYAVKTKKTILAFLHANIDELVGNKIEKDLVLIEALGAFRKKIEANRLVKYWRNKDELAAKITTSLTHAVHDHPSIGWIKANSNVFIEGSDNNKLYIPSRVFNAIETTSVDFNSDLTNELRKSRIFFFRGISGKRCAIRIKYLKNNPNDLQLKFILTHPFKEDISLMDRISHRMRSKNEFNFEEELNNIRYEIQMSIVSLWNIRYHFQSCEIVFQKDTSISRLEIFDHSVYISLFDSNLTDRKYNPPIIKFSDNSIFYEVYRKEAFREFEICGTEDNKLLITRRTTKEDLVQEFSRLKFGILTDEIIEGYINYFKDFELDFIEKTGINKL